MGLDWALNSCMIRRYGGARIASAAGVQKSSGQSSIAALSRSLCKLRQLEAAAIVVALTTAALNSLSPKGWRFEFCQKDVGDAIRISLPASLWLACICSLYVAPSQFQRFISHSNLSLLLLLLPPTLQLSTSHLKPENVFL